MVARRAAASPSARRSRAATYAATILVIASSITALTTIETRVPSPGTTESGLSMSSRSHSACVARIDRMT